MMRKSIFAALLVLIMLLGGCSDVSTAPTRNDESELVTETEAAAEAESTKGIYSSESNERKAPETSAALETAAEVTECKPVQSETVKQTEPVKRSEAEAPATKPTTENNNPPTVETPTQAASENAKTAYDFEFDTELKNFPLFCPKCHKQTLINAKQLNITKAEVPDAKTQSR